MSYDIQKVIIDPFQKYRESRTPVPTKWSVSIPEYEYQTTIKSTSATAAAETAVEEYESRSAEWPVASGRSTVNVIVTTPEGFRLSYTIGGETVPHYFVIAGNQND